MQLCIFHVLKAIRKEVMKLVERESQRQVFAIIHSLVYASSAEIFEQRLEQLQDECIVLCLDMCVTISGAIRTDSIIVLSSLCTM